MSRTLVELGVLLLIAGSVYYAVRADAAADARNEAEIERLEASAKKLAEAAHQQAGRAQRVRRREEARADSAEREQASADSAFTVHVDSLWMGVPDDMRRHVRGLVHADSAEDAALTTRVRSCLTMLTACREERDSWKALAIQRDSLTDAQDRALNPGLFAELFDNVGFGGTCGVTFPALGGGCAVGVTVTVP